MLKGRHHIMSHLSVFSIFRTYLEQLFKTNAIFNGEQEKESIIDVRIEKSLGAYFFYPILTLMINSYSMDYITNKGPN